MGDAILGIQQHSDHKLVVGRNALRANADRERTNAERKIADADMAQCSAKFSTPKLHRLDVGSLNRLVKRAGAATRRSCRAVWRRGVRFAAAEHRRGRLRSGRHVRPGDRLVRDRERLMRKVHARFELLTGSLRCFLTMGACAAHGYRN
jgi:hypothetical protein